MTWSIASYNSTPSGNTLINGINIAEGCNASGINDAIRQMMADLAVPSFNTLGAIGPVSFTSTLSVTGNTTLGGTLSVTGALTAASSTISGAVSAATVAASTSLSAGSTTVPVHVSAAASAGATNYDLGAAALFVNYLLHVRWAGGDGFALCVINSAGGVTTIGSSNTLGSNNAFDTTNSFSSNSSQGIALFINGGHLYLQTKSSYTGGAAQINRFGG